MNKRCTISLLIGFFALLFPELTIAQNSERMLIFTKSGKVFPYRTEYIDSIKFLTGAVDLSLNPQIVPHPNGTTGAMKLSIGSVGEDVARIQVVLPETFQVEKMTDYQCLKFFEPTSTAQTGMQIYEVKGNNEYDLTGMQRGYDYTALFLPYDKMGCAGNVKRLNFTVPLGKLEGNPSIAVSFSDVTTEGFKVKFEPNSDVKGYFYLCDETESSDREQMMKMFGIPDLKHYVVSFGADFATRKAHVGEKEHVFNDFKPGTQYSVFVVLVDAKGQYSDLYKNFTVTTVKKGTSEEATLSIEVSNITESSATVTTTPDKNTSIYRESVILKGAMTDEEMIAYLRDTPESLQLPFRSEAYTQTWENLDVGAAYYAVGLAKNGDGKWGPLAKKEFTLKNRNEDPVLPESPVAFGSTKTVIESYEAQVGGVLDTGLSGSQGLEYMCVYRVNESPILIRIYFVSNNGDGELNEYWAVLDNYSDVYKEEKGALSLTESFLAILKKSGYTDPIVGEENTFLASKGSQYDLMITPAAGGDLGISQEKIVVLDFAPRGEFLPKE